MNFFSVQYFLILIVSIISIPFGFSQDRKINKALEYIQTQKYDDAEEIIKGLQKKNATYAGTYYVQSMLYGSKAFKRYNIDSCYVFYNKAIDAFRTLDIKEQTEICTDFKLCLSNVQNTKDSIAGVAYSEYRSYQKIDKMVAFNNLYKGTRYIQLSNELIEELYYNLALVKNTTEGYLDFINMYPTSTKREDVTKRIHKIEYNLAVSKNDKSFYNDYLLKYPSSSYCKEVEKKIEKLDFEKTKLSMDVNDFEFFLKNYSSSDYLPEILTIYETVYYNESIKNRDIIQMNKFKLIYPTSNYSNDINQLICDVTYESVKEQNTMKAYKEFVKLYPNSKYDKEAKDKIVELFPIVPKLLSNGKYIYIDKFTGVNLFRNEYDKVTLFKNSQAIVMQNSKYGVIDENGRTIIPTKYDEVTRCTNPDLYLVTLNNKMNVFNNEGKKLLKADSDIQLREQNNDFIAFNNSGKEYSEGPSDYVFRIVNKELVKQQYSYDAIPEFDSNGIAIVTKGKIEDYNNLKIGNYSIINTDLQELVPPKYNQIINAYSHPELYLVNIGAEAAQGEGIVIEGGKWGLMNANGKVLLPVIFDELNEIAPQSSEIYFEACKNGNCGIIDLKGNEIIPFEYQGLDYGINNQLVAWKSDKVGVIDLKNNIKIPFVHDGITSSESNYIVSKSLKTKDENIVNKYGIISPDNKLLLPVKYDYINTDLGYNFLSVSLGCRFYASDGWGYAYGGKWGLLDKNATFILNPNFSEITSTSDSNLIQVNMGKVFNDDFIAEVKNEGKFGLSDKQGKLILPIKFEQIELTSELIFAKYNGKYQIYTKTGELILDSKIDAISELKNNFISYRSGEKNGILKPDGSELFPPRFWATKNEYGYSDDISLEGPYFRIEEAGQVFYATDKGEVFKEY